jgi:tetratricopeptide (TPR) repeat protein
MPRSPATISVEEVQHALTSIVTNPAFGASPQLAAFLRFVVDAALNGRSDRIKGYTIAVEALGRDASFDPQADPIVRVEAGRLRRALDRYYAEVGQCDPIVIELPRGSYVPVFRRRILVVETPRLLARMAARFGALTGHRPHATTWLAVAASILVYALVDLIFLDPVIEGAKGHSQATSPAQAAHSPERRFYVGPSIYIAPITVSGDSLPFGQAPAMLEARLRDVFARFDDITIISELPGSGRQSRQPADYRLVTAIEYADFGLLNVRFQLVDDADGSIAWTRLVERLDATGDQRATHVKLAREIAGELLQPLGVVHARERTKQATRSDRDPRYACLLESFSYFRTYDHTRHDRVRRCLEDATTEDPTFASGLSSLARLYFREYLSEPGEDAANRSLERALEAARRAIDVNPNNVRAHYMLIDIHMARGEIAEAMAAGERVLTLNPYDNTAVFHYSAQLVLLGDIERGMRMISESVRHAGTMPVRYTFILAMSAYLKGDFATALAYANQLSANEFPLGLMLQAATRLRTGDRERARAAAEKLAELYPSWRADPRRQLKKFLPLPWVVDRVETDLREAGLGTALASAPDSLPANATPATRSPVVMVEPIESARPRLMTGAEAGAMRAEIVRTFSRFEDVEIVAPPPQPASANLPGVNIDYRLATTVGGTDGFAITVTLTDGDGGTVLWSKTYERASPGDDGEFAFVGDMAGPILNPFGVIASRERSRVSERPGFARYRCMLEAADYLRGYAPTTHVATRGCLEDAVAADPGFSSGFTMLARVYLREHLAGIQVGNNETPALERARAAAERAIALNPNSARAHVALFQVRAAMGDAAGVRRHGEVAIMLNPHDNSVVFSYGAQLVMMGDVDAGLGLVLRVADAPSVPSASLDFTLFLASYLKGDWASASRHAKRIANETFVPGYVARVLTAQRTEDSETTRWAVDRLAALDPAWCTDARAELAKFITAPALIEQFAHELASAGLRPQRATQNSADLAVTVR